MKRAFSTNHWPHRPAWDERVDSVDPRSLSRKDAIRSVLRAAKDHELIVLNGAMSGRADFVAAAAIARRRHPPKVLFTECTWNEGGSRLDRLARRAMVRAIDGDHVTYCVLGGDERNIFPGLWGVDTDRVVFTPWFVGLSDEELAAPTLHDGFVFAGGDSHRDYATLLAAAKDIPAPVRIASRVLDEQPTADNVTAGPVSPAEFTDLSRRASVVVVPLELRTDRSAGQFTYLNAMAMGKPVVVTDALGVRDHVEHERTALVVPPNDPRALAEAVTRLLDPANAAETKAMAERGKRDARERFSAERYVERLVELVDQLLAEP